MVEKKDELKPGEVKGDAAKGDTKPNLNPKSAADDDTARSTGALTGGSTEAQQKEYEDLGVNALLDNRTGNQRPVLSPILKPQQIDGPEVGHFKEHAEKFGAAAEKALATVDGEVLGSQSKGPWGRGELDDGRIGARPEDAL